MFSERNHCRQRAHSGACSRCSSPRTWQPLAHGGSGNASSSCSSTTGCDTGAGIRSGTWSTRTRATESGQPILMEKIIKAAVDRGASDLHIKAGDVFRARIDGKLQPLTKQALSPEQTRAIALKLIPNEEDRARIDKIQDYDCSWGAQGVGRFRVNILRQRSSFMIVMRVIPFEVPTFEKLKLPPVLAQIAHAERGMILVTGVTGSGKSSTMAAMINYINANTHKHILSLENPIEFLHRDIQCSITQRE